jgi:hypothetical protein
MIIRAVAVTPKTVAATTTVERSRGRVAPVARLTTAVTAVATRHGGASTA